ncbi:hypothetical protein PENTCL1PPCAC_10163, partial [Pristionchus entomophagus]
RDGEALYWKTSLAEIPFLLSSIFLTCSVQNVCASVDLSDSAQSWFEMLRQCKCEAMSIKHVKAKTKIERDGGWQVEEEPAVLSPTLFTSEADFFE